MKVGILTFPNSKSYGATMQMYALYQTIYKLGHEAEIINYYSKYMKAEKYCRPKGMSDLKYSLRYLARRILHARMYAAFAAFEQQNMEMYPNRFFTGKDKLPTIGARYGAVVCGSDQVWNPDITGRDLSYFLDFCGEGTRRVAYAPSFGVEALPEEYAKRVGEELSQFAALSVREAQGQAMVADMIGREVPVVIDPTMLLDAEQWQQLEEHFPVDGDFVLYYTVKSSPRLYAKCRAFAEQQGLRMVVVGGNRMRRNDDAVVRHAIDISPAVWLWLVHHARYVVTNSFHGTAFSIIFEKNFYLELSAKTNSRLTNIVKLLDLEDRVIPFEQEIVPSQANFETAKKNMLDMRERSIDYLRNALREDDIHG
jgi:hypothetical protein